MQANQQPYFVGLIKTKEGWKAIRVVEDTTGKLVLAHKN